MGPQALCIICTPQQPSATMNSMFVFAAVMACASAANLYAVGPVAVRAPSHDSAIIQSHRLGGNFAYSTHEAHAYAVQTPVIGHRTVPSVSPTIKELPSSSPPPTTSPNRSPVTALHTISTPPSELSLTTHMPLPEPP